MTTQPFLLHLEQEEFTEIEEIEGYRPIDIDTDNLLLATLGTYEFEETARYIIKESKKKGKWVAIPIPKDLGNQQGTQRINPGLLEEMVYSGIIGVVGEPKPPLREPISVWGYVNFGEHGFGDKITHKVFENDRLYFLTSAAIKKIGDKYAKK